MKKYLVYIITVAIILMSTAVSFADTQEIVGTEEAPPIYGELIKDNNVVILSEYDILSDLKQQTDETLKLDGFTDQEISELRDYDPRVEIKNIAQKSEEELKNLNYTQEEIILLKKIKDMPISEINSAEAYTVGAKVALTLKKVSYAKGKASTTGVIKATWAWNRQPSTQAYDVLAFSWGKSFGSVNKDSEGKAYCKDVHGKNWKTYDLSIWDKNPNAGCAFKFKINGGSYGSISSGYAQVKLYQSDSAVNSVETRVTYGHTAVAIEPSVSWNGISVTFRKSMKNMGHENLLLK